MQYELGMKIEESIFFNFPWTKKFLEKKHFFYGFLDYVGSNKG